MPNVYHEDDVWKRYVKDADGDIDQAKQNIKDVVKEHAPEVDDD